MGTDRCLLSLIELEVALTGSFLQLEIMLNFFIGFHDAGCYEDGLAAIAKRNLSNYSLFWFDACTSIPLSYLDLYYSKVRSGSIS